MAIAAAPSSSSIQRSSNLHDSIHPSSMLGSAKQAVVPCRVAYGLPTPDELAQLQIEGPLSGVIQV